MTSPVGAKTVVFWSVSPGELDRKSIPVSVYTGTEVTGCQIQPMHPKEKVTNIDYAIQIFEVFAPAAPAALACQVDDYVQDGLLGAEHQTATLTTVNANGPLYRVIGTRPWYLPNGAPHHVTVFVEVPSGIP